MSSFLKWVAGIIAAVISGVLIYYLTTPKGPAPSQTSIQIEGRVIDLATKKLIEGAHVTLRAGKYSGSQFTDTSGRYGFDVSLPETTEATFEIAAAGYPQYSVNCTLKRLSEIEDNDLLHEAVGGGNAAGVYVPPPPPASQQPGSGAGAQIGGLGGGGKGAAIAAAIGAVVNHGAPSAKPSVPSPSQVQGPGTPKTTVVLPPYVRRRDFTKIGP